MKILKIEFRNINSLKETHSIDFTIAPFTTNSLFAITGPTGSGKSTILDVISLALFNHVPRLGKISKKDILEKGAILTRNQQEAFARVTYECKSGIFTSEWNISTARTGSLRDYDMQISNQPTGEILALKKSDVPGKNEQLIGLNYNQFIKSVLLAQGEFSQFLKAKKDERGELLEKITGTGIYRQLGRLAYERHKLVNVEIQKQQDFITQLEIDLLQKEELTALARELEEKEKNCKPLEEEIKTFERNLDLKRTIENHEREIQKYSTEKEKAARELEVFLKTYGNKLEQHEKLREVADDLRTWSRSTLEYEAIEKEIKDKTGRKTANNQELEQCFISVKGLTKTDIKKETLESGLEKFAQEVRKLQEDLLEKKNEYKNLQQELRAETRELSCDLNINDPNLATIQLEEIKNKAGNHIAELEKVLTGLNLNAPQLEKLRLKNNLQLAREAHLQHEKMNNLEEDLQRLQREEQKIIQQLEGLPQEINNQEQKVNSLKDKIQIVRLKKQNQLLLSSLEDKRGDLIDGEPCPLCGALHHPYIDSVPQENDNLDDELTGLERDFAHFNSKLTAGITSLNHHKQTLEAVEKQKKIQEKDLENLKENFHQNFEHLQKEERVTWKMLCENYENILEKLEEYVKEKLHLNCVETGLPIIKKMNVLSDKGRILKDRLSSLYPGKDIITEVQQLQTRWTRLRENERSIEQHLEELVKKGSAVSNNLKNLENEVFPKIRDKEFSSLQQATEALMPENHYYQLHTDRDKIQKEILRNTETLNLLESQLKNYKLTDVEQNTQELQKLKDESSERLEIIRTACEQLKRRLINDRENRAKILKIKEGIAAKEKQIKRWKLLNELIGDATGKKFNDFAQDLSLSQLLLLANIRLNSLSDRYKLDKPVEGEDDGLVAIDEHMGGQRRSVKTLSGGETFILSLSMALALSDLASRNVEINSLFIDEGFGTLDPETLDQTLDTLEKLQAESSKTIGIISHVDSLKERIATQIQLKRHGQGYSTLEITA